MPNPQNLLRGETINAANAKEKGRNGGIKSGIARRERKRLRDVLNGMLSENDGALCSDLMAGAVARAKDGDQRALEYITKMVGEDPRECDPNYVASVVLAASFDCLTDGESTADRARKSERLVELGRIIDRWINAGTPPLDDGQTLWTKSKPPAPVMTEEQFQRVLEEVNNI